MEDLTSIPVKTKVMCTIGPSSKSKETIIDMINKGMTLARLNMVHGTAKDNEEIIKNIREAEKETGKIVGIMADLKGPQIRTGRFSVPEKKVFLKANQKFYFHTNYVHGDNTKVTVEYWDLPKYLKKGHKLIVDYGRLEFVVDDIKNRIIETTILNDGILGENKIMTISGLGEEIEFPFLGFQDTVDIDFAVNHNLDFICGSRITKPEDIDELRTLPGVEESGIKILAKIENSRTIKQLKSILQSSDGIIITRSDIAIETPLEKVAPLQKLIARSACLQGKPVYIQNQILGSMTINPRPTRAECTDIANAVLDGVDGVILTNCTAIGNYPSESVQVAISQCLEVEKNLHYKDVYNDIREECLQKNEEVNETEAITSSAVKTARDVSASVIVVVTKFGDTASSISKYHPHLPVLCVTTEKSARYVQLFRSTFPVVANIQNSETMTREVLVNEGIKAAKKLKFLKNNEYVIAVTGKGFDMANMLEVICSN